MCEIQDVKLVELVRKHPKLYNAKHPLHKHSNIREDAWLEIATVLEQPMEACKSRWKNIRDTYTRRESRRAQSPGSSRSKRLRKWHLEKHLTFLKHIQYEKQSSANAAALETSDDNTYKGDPGYSENSITETFDETDITDSNLADSIIESICGQQVNERTKKETRSVSKRKRDSTKSSVDNTVELFTQNFDDRPEDQHPIDIFFKSMSMSVKKLSVENQIRAKMQICQIVGQLELGEIRPSPSPSTS